MRKLVLFLSVCSVLGGALVANAEILPCYVDPANGGATMQIGYEEFPNGINGNQPGYTEVAFFLTGVTGAATGGTINAIESSLNGGAINGTGWTDTGGTFWLCSNNNLWQGHTANALLVNANYGGSDGSRNSTENFVSAVGAFSGFTRTGSGTAYTQFGGSWNQNGVSANNWVPSLADDGSVNNLIADLFVTPSTTNIAWQGEVSFSNIGPANLSFSILNPVPEPSTLALLASGLVGLLCYAWRKRK